MNGYPFIDRTDAGRKLGRALEKYRDRDTLVLAIPRGGVHVGHEVARHLDAGFSIVVARKLPYPDNPEAGFGAVSEDGSVYVDAEAKRWVTPKTIDRAVEEQKREITRRIEVLRGGAPLPDPRGRTVILVDDGIAVGSTMRAAIATLKKAGAGRIVVAAPVTGTRTKNAIGALVDEIVILETPRFFRAVAQVYENWYDVPDKEVLEIMAQWKRER